MSEINVNGLRSAIQNTMRSDAYHPMIEYYQALPPATGLALLNRIAEMGQRVADLERALQYIADDCADPSPPSYGAIRQAAKQAIAKSASKEA